MPPAHHKNRNHAASPVPTSKTEGDPQSVPPCLPPHRAASIGELTAKARALHAELVENSAKADALQFRNAAIRRDLAEIDTKVREHAWEGRPLA